jgi:hypothetical protein
MVPTPSLFCGFLRSVVPRRLKKRLWRFLTYSVSAFDGYETHRETKQLVGLERCQCRKARAQRNHIACANLAWVILKRAAYAFKTTVYQLKEKLFDDFITKILNNPLTFVT